MQENIAIHGQRLGSSDRTCIQVHMLLVADSYVLLLGNAADGECTTGHSQHTIHINVSKLVILCGSRCLLGLDMHIVVDNKVAVDLQALKGVLNGHVLSCIQHHGVGKDHTAHIDTFVSNRGCFPKVGGVLGTTQRSIAHGEHGAENGNVIVAAVEGRGKHAGTFAVAGALCDTGPLNAGIVGLTQTLTDRLVHNEGLHALSSLRSGAYHCGSGDLPCTTAYDTDVFLIPVVIVIQSADLTSNKPNGFTVHFFGLRNRNGCILEVHIHGSHIADVLCFVGHPGEETLIGIHRVLHSFQSCRGGILGLRLKVGIVGSALGRCSQNQRGHKEDHKYHHHGDNGKEDCTLDSPFLHILFHK